MEILNYRVRGGDTELENHLKNHKKNASYLSKTMQNEIIFCCDEAIDVSNKSQISLVLRYVDSGLDITNCRGQGYDGAGAVAGTKKGVAARILKLNNKALYTHCFSHRLNLAVCNSCKVQFLCNAMNHIKEVSYYFNLSIKRNSILETMVSEHCLDKKKTKLRDVCRTRWLERIDGLDTFQELYVPIVYSLEAISNDRNKFGADSQTATSLFKLITTFKFIVSLVVTRAVFDETHVVTNMLQSSSLDIQTCIDLIFCLTNRITTFKNKIDSFHDKCYLDAKVIAEQIGVDECRKRTVGRQIHCDNHPVENTSEFFKRVLTISDHLDLALSDRFCNDNLTLFHGLNIIPDKIISLLNGPSEKNNWRESIKIFSDFFSEDLPNPLALEAECGLWEI
ncbi:52 kDa repressor of the inhibitor of the protein kinase-like [Hydra vulgaris]|uniref:52 kDa repressor of the inhibitor of the protein kinase-like n=1 Tax=Hydra vulgaris TaxID=6087 RepID=A0ABM4CSF0_HYDVU